MLYTAARAMQALELLALHPLSAPQVAASLAVDARTARRLLNRLCEDGWLTRSDDHRRVYSPTLRVAALAGHVVNRTALADAAVPHVRALAGRLGAPAHLMIPSYRWVLCIVHGDGGEPRRGVHEVQPCHATAAGKALLGRRADWRESVLAAPLPRSTARTLAAPAAIRAAAAEASALGYATEDGELRDGSRSVAAPVCVGRETVAALSVDVPGARALDAVGPLVAEHARRLGMALEDR
jgi:IclR family pca regulon transcriptional regulator